jgi:hypothetical protein
MLKYFMAVHIYIFLFKYHWACAGAVKCKIFPAVNIFVIFTRELVIGRRKGKIKYDKCFISKSHLMPCECEKLCWKKGNSLQWRIKKIKWKENRERERESWSWNDKWTRDTQGVIAMCNSFTWKYARLNLINYSNRTRLSILYSLLVSTCDAIKDVARQTNEIERIEEDL